MEPLPEKGKKVWRAHQIAKYIGQSGYKVEYYTSKFDHFAKQYRNNKKCNTSYKVSLINATGYYSNKSILRILSNLTFAVNLLAKALKINEKVIWIISYPHGYGLLAIAIRKLIRRKDKIIVDIRDNPTLNGDDFPKRLYNIVESIVIDLSSKQVDLWIGAGERILQYLELKIRRRAEKKFIYLPMTGEGYQNTGIEKTRDVLFVGTLTENFELEALLECVQETSHRKLHVIGDGHCKSILKINMKVMRI